MTQEHPITPPLELVQEWTIAALGAKDWLGGYNLELIATQAACWGADQELEACCEWISEKNYSNYPFSSHELRTARRPKQPTLKEQALKELRQLPIDPELGVCASALDTIRKALEALPND